MKVIVIGYGEMFASLITGVLDSGNEIVGVVRNENIIYSPLKRFLLDIFSPTSDKSFVDSLELNDIKIKSVNSLKFRKIVKRLGADIILVGSWSEKFSEETINSPKIACINTHPSLLPEFRGPNPYIRVILANKNISGITFHLMDNNYDTGKILSQVKTEIMPYETGFSLKLKCCELARNEVGNVINNLDEIIQSAIVQDEEKSSYQKQIDLSETILNFEKETSLDIERRIRAFTPWQNCYIPYNDEFFEFRSYKILNDAIEAQPASIVDKTNNSVSIVCKDRKIIKFSGLKLKRPFFSLFTDFYIKFFIEINSKAL